MATHIGLLRGVNIGKAKRVPMADLRALVSGFGYGNARTLLNSGNVLFDAPGVAPAEAAARIEGGLVARLGVSARVVVITADELAGVVAGNPLTQLATDPARLAVGFVADPAVLRGLDPLLRTDWSPEVLAVGERAVYLWLALGFADGALTQAVGKVLRDGVTMRNWATVMKLAALAGS